MSSRIPDAVMTMDGLVVFQGVTMTYPEYLDAVDYWIAEHVEVLKDLRDPQSDIQNLWGHKAGHFQDDIYGRTPPIKGGVGYPRDIGDDDWKI